MALTAEMEQHFRGLGLPIQPIPPAQPTVSVQQQPSQPSVSSAPKIDPVSRGGDTSLNTKDGAGNINQVHQRNQLRHSNVDQAKQAAAQGKQAEQKATAQADQQQKQMTAGADVTNGAQNRSWAGIAAEQAIVASGIAGASALLGPFALPLQVLSAIKSTGDVFAKAGETTHLGSLSSSRQYDKNGQPEVQSTSQPEVITAVRPDSPSQSGGGHEYGKSRDDKIAQMGEVVGADSDVRAFRNAFNGIRKADLGASFEFADGGSSSVEDPPPGMSYDFFSGGPVLQDDEPMLNARTTATAVDLNAIRLEGQMLGGITGIAAGSQQSLSMALAELDYANSVDAQLEDKRQNGIEVTSKTAELAAQNNNNLDYKNENAYVLASV